MTSLQFKIRGLDCAEEIAVLKREVGPLVGGEDRLAFDLLRAKMTVLDPPAGMTEERIAAAVERGGMRAQSWAEVPEELDRPGLWQRRGRSALTAVSGVAVSAGLAAQTLWGSVGAARILYAIAILAGSWFVFPKALLSLRRLRPDMNLLMTIAVLGAVAIGEWFEAASVAFLFSVSLALESWSVGRARRAVAALMDLSPRTARLRRPDGRDEELPAERVEVGSRLIVKPGERIPLDGRVVAGASHVNQAPITGESRAVAKERGDEVFAGTINGDGALEVETTRRAEDTTLAHVIRLVEEAQSRRTPSEQWVEKFARVYTPAVMALALAVLLFPPLVLGGAWQVWTYRALVLLVIACPCALVISTPVSIVAALAAAARHGVLIKGGLFLEIPA
ncbi:MAG TPA: HAD-IC family P-type ATPase, partial [Thermoanaerobaculia bacterium]|nr:HAD-IC family P-type ATPase [Thermoanaerobaculia bacterium]